MIIAHICNLLKIIQMELKQIALLTDLAKNANSEKKDKEKVVATLQSAKILTKSGNFTIFQQSEQSC